MKIRMVEYGRLVSHGEFNNTKIAAMAAVEEDESPEAALAALNEWVNDQLNARVHRPEELISIEAKIRKSKWELQDIEMRFNRAKSGWQKMVDILERHGVQVNENPFDDMPF